MNSSLEVFKAFIKDEDAWNMYISGPAGSGKTTDLRSIVQHCRDSDLSVIVCAYTHKACNIIRSVLPEGSEVRTLHSFLVKRPSINEHAVKVEHLSTSRKMGVSEKYGVLLLDEYSQVGEKDYLDIVSAQDPDYEGKVKLKVVYIGDQNQLPPVGDMPAIVPCGKYNVTLTKIWRQAGDNPLLDTLSQLVSFISKEKKPEPLIISNNFIRGINIVQKHASLFANGKDLSDMVMLAYTNERVEQLNAMVAGRTYPEEKDELFSPSTRQLYTFVREIANEGVEYVSRAYNDDDLTFGSKYKTLEHLLTMPDIKYMLLTNEDSLIFTYAAIFGHYQYKKYLEVLGARAVECNAAIEKVSEGLKAKVWAFNNNHSPLARARAKAWRDYMTFKECVICLDFPYAMTVHKSQGSTFDTVLIDTQDLAMCADRDYQTYLKLMYVAISRASNMVYTN